MSAEQWNFKRRGAEDAEAGCFPLVGYFFASLFLVTGAMLWRGYALCHLWAWFIVSGFHTSALSLPLAIGLNLITAFLTKSIERGSTEDKTKSYTRRFGEDVFYAFGSPAVVLGFGFIVKHWL